MNLNEDNIQEAYFINNKYINIQYYNPGIFRGIKAGGKGFKVFFINNYFEKIIISSNVQLHKPNIYIYITQIPRKLVLRFLLSA